MKTAEEMLLWCIPFEKFLIKVRKKICVYEQMKSNPLAQFDKIKTRK
jgi:hypothetical protein